MGPSTPVRPPHRGQAARNAGRVRAPLLAHAVAFVREGQAGSGDWVWAGSRSSHMCRTHAVTHPGTEMTWWAGWAIIHVYNTVYYTCCETFLGTTTCTCKLYCVRYECWVRTVNPDPQL